MTTYCDVARGHPWHGPYHDREYGFPIRLDQLLFERLVLEINQAGLSWLTILKKRTAFRRAYDRFDLETVAGYGARDRRRLLADAGIIRNRLKVEWVGLFKKTFRFTGGEIVGEFLLSTGFLPGAHAPDCPVYPRVLARRPAWMTE